MKIEGNVQCAVCGRPVDAVATATDPRTGAFVIVASCHGQREEVAIPRAALETADNISLGLAFDVNGRLAA